VSEKFNFTILVAPLDWGLGHATRCTPLITHLLELGCKVIIAAEGASEKLLKTEFPQLQFVNLAGYRISYSASKRFFSLKIAAQLPKIILAIRKEKKWLEKFVAKTSVDVIISDNRYGLHHPSISSVFITHQLLIKAPSPTVERMLQRLHNRLIERFETCWVPDFEGSVNLAGVLSHPVLLPKIKLRYLGGLSRLTAPLTVEKEYDLLAIISGPEPQRTLLEKKLLKELASYPGKVLLVRGLPGVDDELPALGNIFVKNHLPAKELASAFTRSEYIISRSGYTTVMDIFKLRKKAVLIPTPGQTEQEYLAEHLEQQGWCIKIRQTEFSLQRLGERINIFEYKLPQFNMEHYKIVVKDYLAALGK
jgi:uncharacterized protein (TIGR00661 family)